MDRHDEEMSPAELEIKERIEIDYGNWPEIVGLISAAFVVFIMFVSSDGSY